MVFERLGYQAATRDVLIEPEEVVYLDVMMGIEAIPLDPIVVSVIPRRTLHRVAELQHSINLGHGYFIVASQLEERGYPSVEFLLRTLPGMRIIRGTPVFREYRSFGMGLCPPVFYVDGIKMRHWSLAIDLPTIDFEYVETYKGPATTPAAYLDSGSRCGVVAFWTKRGSALPVSLLVDFGRR